ncbi:MAG: hypothetical protein HGA44_02195 [Cellulomonadaceae bacterium]|nr:hypothetical protein [Cellulomonadaceae bacterium]
MAHVDITEQFERIQQQALDSSIPLADTLRLCIAVGGRLNAPGLIKWANAELDGYGVENELPEYRTVHAPMMVSYFLGPNRVQGQVVTADLVDPEFRPKMHDVPLREALASLEEMAKREQETISMVSEHSGDMGAMIKRNTADPTFLTITSVYWDVPRIAFGSVVDKVRTKLVTMVAEFDVAVRQPGVSTVAAARDAISVVVEPGGVMNMNSAPVGSIVTGGDKSVITSNNAGRDVVATTAGGDIKDSSTSGTSRAQQTPPRFWETAWWTVGKVIVGSVGLVVAGLAAYFTYLAI